VVVGPTWRKEASRATDYQRCRVQQQQLLLLQPAAAANSLRAATTIAH